MVAPGGGVVVLALKLLLNLAVDTRDQRSCYSVRDLNKGCVEDLELFLCKC